MRKRVITITMALLLAAPLWAERGLHRYGLAQLPHPVGKPTAQPERQSVAEADGAKIVGSTGKNGSPESLDRDYSTPHPKTRAY